MNKQVCKNISKWIEAYLVESGLESLIVGVSGGVDSALVSALCAMTGHPTYVLNIPIRSKDQNTSLSDLQCRWLQEKYDNVSYLTVDLTDTYNTYRAQVLSHLEPNELAFANAKSRLRMILLYQWATTYRGLVVGTGNKVEDFGVGFYTKYGDGGVDLSPIADLTKTQVRAAATTVGIPQAILDAPPTDGLWEDSRTDEEQIGASYEELEWAMHHVDNSRNEAPTPRQKEVLDIFMGYRKQNQHKMSPIPVYNLDIEED